MKKFITTTLLLTLSLLQITPSFAQTVPPMGVSVSIPIDFSGSQKQLGEIQACKIASAQLNGYGHQTIQEKPSYWKELGEVLAATIIFSGLDYAFFNWFRSNEDSITHYRIFQGTTQVALSAILFYRNGGPEQWAEGLKVAGAFNLLWWTFNADLLYYGMAELDAPGAFKGDSDPNGWAMRHAKWTPYGLAKSAVSGKPWGETLFTPREIWTQALTGQALTLGLLGLNFWNDPKNEINQINKKIQNLQEELEELNRQLEIKQKLNNPMQIGCTVFPEAASSIASMPFTPMPAFEAPRLFEAPHVKDAYEAAFDRAFSKQSK